MYRPLYRADTFAEHSQLTTFGDVRVVNGVRKLMSTFTSTLNTKATEHQQYVIFSPIENIYLSSVSSLLTSGTWPYFPVHI
jgi:hypothetical protein